MTVKDLLNKIIEEIGKDPAVLGFKVEVELGGETESDINDIDVTPGTYPDNWPHPAGWFTFVPDELPYDRNRA